MSRDRERGFLAAELAIGVGLLLFPVALVVLTLPSWSERQATARAIAREVARAAAMAGRCDHDRADATSAAMATNLGLPTSDVRTELECAAGSRLVRGGVVLLSVRVSMPAVEIPGIGQVGAWAWTARHREPVDPYRSFDP